MKRKQILTKAAAGMAAATLLFSLGTVSVSARGRNYVDANRDGVCDYCGTECSFVDEDGERLLHTVKLQFLDYKEALDKLLHTQSITSYLEQEELLSISVVGKNEQKCQEMLTDIETSLPRHHNVCCSMGNQEEAKAAHNAGLSVGKYRAFLKLQEKDPSITLEEIKEMTMREIEERLLSFPAEEDTDTKQHPNKHQHQYRHRHGAEKGCS